MRPAAGSRRIDPSRILGSARSGGEGGQGADEMGIRFAGRGSRDGDGAFPRGLLCD